MQTYLMYVSHQCCSLLDVLAGRKDRNSVFGYVLINGDRQPENFQFASGYVVQV